MFLILVFMIRVCLFAKIQKFYYIGCTRAPLWYLEAWKGSHRMPKNMAGYDWFVLGRVSGRCFLVLSNFEPNIVWVCFGVVRKS